VLQAARLNGGFNKRSMDFVWGVNCWPKNFGEATRFLGGGRYNQQPESFEVNKNESFGLSC
jgi:hypothetical protein